jgi:hypothetical protein
LAVTPLHQRLAPPASRMAASPDRHHAAIRPTYPLRALFWCRICLEFIIDLRHGLSGALNSGHHFISTISVAGFCTRYFDLWPFCHRPSYGRPAGDGLPVR